MMVHAGRDRPAAHGREHLSPYAATVFNMFGPDNELRRAAIAQMVPHVAGSPPQCKRDALADDGIGAMMHAAADAGEVTRQEAELLVRSLRTAGFDTTVHGSARRCGCSRSTPISSRRCAPSRPRRAPRSRRRWD